MRWRQARTGNWTCEVPEGKAVAYLKRGGWRWSLFGQGDAHGNETFHSASGAKEDFRKKYEGEPVRGDPEFGNMDDESLKEWFLITDRDEIRCAIGDVNADSFDWTPARQPFCLDAFRWRKIIKAELERRGLETPTEWKDKHRRRKEACEHCGSEEWICDDRSTASVIRCSRNDFVVGDFFEGCRTKEEFEEREKDIAIHLKKLGMGIFSAIRAA